MSPALEIENLSVNYGGFQALDNINLNLGAGTITALIGPNGAGKTSLIKAICGRLDIDAGRVSIQGQPLTPHTSRSKTVGLVPQDIALYPFLTARENLAIFAKYLSLPRQEQSEAVERALAHVDMTEKADVRTQHMSGGMKRRINVAAAIMHNPSILILDEPTAGVDTPARDAIHGLLKQLAAKGMAIILVTHELDEVEHYCDHIIFLAKGKLLAHASGSQILSHAFGDTREVVVDLTHKPSEGQQRILHKFSLRQGSVPTRWQIFTPINNETYLTELIKAMESLQPNVRDVSIRRPNLTRLMEIAERTGHFPSKTKPAAMVSAAKAS